MTQQTTAPPAPDPEDLRCEYQTSEAHVATLTSGVWQSAAIVVGGSIAAFAVLIGVRATVAVAVGVTVLALGAIVVTEMWRHNWRRHKVSINKCWIRMREIERARGMRKNIGLYCFTKGRKEFPKPPGVLAWFSLHKFKGTGQDVLHGTACLVEVGWVLMLVFKWVECVCALVTNGDC